MNKMESLNSFFIERLMSVAGEICAAVKEAVCEYQEEVERTKQENQRLKEILTEITVCINTQAQRAADLQLPRADGDPPEQNSDQRPLDSHLSELQLNLELSTTEQDPDPRPPLNNVSASSSAFVHGPDPASQAVRQEFQNFSQEPLDTNPPIIQVKEELPCSLRIMHQNTEAHKPLNNPLSPSSSPSAAAVYNEEPPQHPFRDIVKEEIGAEGPHTSESTIKLEPWDSQGVCSDNGTVVQTENLSENHLEALREGPDSIPSLQYTVQSDNVPQSQSPAGLFCCRYCRKSFKSRGQLKQHMVVHQKYRPYRCDVCGKSYSYAQVLEIHYRTHTGERPYNCRFCGRSFRQRSHLTDHERIHTGEKPYSCTVCGKRFIQSSQVKKHFRNLHQRTVYQK
ncbi:adult enhancer factor 1 [Astyanax mexicanus]|uniref:adult enhancer factor 1 n=1 Tax=Astyanax mexicanus TaxID=7994 RepID=UPI0020CB4A74|nr:adult enhancer factor 1 [Astyanax mexicanus]